MFESRGPAAGRMSPAYRTAIGAALAATLATALCDDARDDTGEAPALAQSKYPDLKGSGTASSGADRPAFVRSDQALGRGRQAPLTAEYQAILDANLRTSRTAGTQLHRLDLPAYGMPMMMYAFAAVEFVVTPETTYVLINHQDAMRRIYTDGRTMPPNAEPTFAGYSVGRWIAEKGDGN